MKTFFYFYFFFGDRLKNFCEDLFFFFLESTCALCPWPLALASSIPVLGLDSVCPRKGCPRPWPRIFFVSLALASSLVSSTPPLVAISKKICCLSSYYFLVNNLQFFAFLRSCSYLHSCSPTYTDEKYYMKSQFQNSTS